MKSLAGFVFGLFMYGMGLVNGLGGPAYLVIPIGVSLMIIGTIVLTAICIKGCKDERTGT